MLNGINNIIKNYGAHYNNLCTMNMYCTTIIQSKKIAYKCSEKSKIRLTKQHNVNQKLVKTHPDTSVETLHLMSTDFFYFLWNKE
jgi:membrane-bound inhibitor of C-type lysozyme